MATIVENPGPDRVVERERVVETNGGGGWAVAVIILIVVIAIGAYYWSNRGPAPAPEQDATEINVTLPANSGQQPGPAE